MIDGPTIAKSISVLLNGQMRCLSAKFQAMEGSGVCADSNSFLLGE
jgi:hypothetical protein